MPANKLSGLFGIETIGPYGCQMTHTDGRIDAQLSSLVLAAEKGETCPRVRLLVGGWLVQGEPISTSLYLQITEKDFSESIHNSKEARKFRGSDQEFDGIVKTRVAGMMAPFGTLSEGDHLSITLRDAVVINTVTLQIPALRVPLSSVQAWWNASMIIEEAKRSSSGIAVGFSF